MKRFFLATLLTLALLAPLTAQSWVVYLPTIDWRLYPEYNLFTALRDSTDTTISAMDVSLDSIRIHEDGGSLLDVTTRSVRAGQLLDLIFVIDRSGSMGDDVRFIHDQLPEFVDSLENSRFITWRMGLVTFDTYPSEITRYGGTNLTANLDTLQRWFNSVPASGGMAENAVNGIYAALQYHRTELAQCHIVIIGDEPIQYTYDNCPYPIPMAIDSLRALGIVVDAFPLRDDGYDTLGTWETYQRVATGTGGLTRRPSGYYVENLLEVVNGLVVSDFNGVLIKGTTPRLTIYQDPLMRSLEVEITYHGRTYAAHKDFSLVMPSR